MNYTISSYTPWQCGALAPTGACDGAAISICINLLSISLTENYFRMYSSWLILNSTSLQCQESYTVMRDEPWIWP